MPAGTHAKYPYKWNHRHYQSLFLHFHSCGFIGGFVGGADAGEGDERTPTASVNSVSVLIAPPVSARVDVAFGRQESLVSERAGFPAPAPAPAAAAATAPESFEAALRGLTLGGASGGNNSSGCAGRFRMLGGVKVHPLHVGALAPWEWVGRLGGPAPGGRAIWYDGVLTSLLRKVCRTLAT